MWMDEALYLNKEYEREFEATVIDANGKFIVLDKTLFYPNSGGQLHDTGKLVSSNGEEYDVNFVGKFNDHISHELSKEGLKVGDKVKGIIDWNRRYTLMRHHTAAHILSGVIFKEFGCLITGNQLGLEESRMDFNMDNFEKNKFLIVEAKANEIISKSYKVNKSFISIEEAKEKKDLFKLAKKLPSSIEKIRVVEIDDFDLQACGGTHVDNVFEIGKIRISKLKNKGKNNRRLYFKIED